MITQGITEIRITTDTEKLIKNYICGNITSMAEVARYMSKYEGKEYSRQSAVNLVTAILPYWYKIGKVDINTHTADKVGEL